MFSILHIISEETNKFVSDNYESGLNENPDMVYVEDNNEVVSTDWRELNAYPFFQLMYSDDYGNENDVIVGQNGMSHKLSLPKNIAYKNSGRIWTDEKIISFWQYPKQEEFKDLIIKLGEALNIDIWNDPKYRLEIKNDRNDDILIPLQQYVKSQNPTPQEYQQHIQSPLIKKSTGVPQGVGSKRYGEKKPLAYRQAMSMDEDKLYKIIKEEIESPLDPNFQISFIPNGYEHKILDETYQSIDEIKKLANDVLLADAAANVEMYNKDGQFKHIYGYKLSDMKADKYPELKNFIIESNIYIMFSPSNETGDTYTRGNYERPLFKKDEKFNPSLDKKIELFYDYNEFKEDIDEIITKYGEVDDKDVYFKMFYAFDSSLVHELQHAYDDYRSEGNAFKTKEYNNFLAKYEKSINYNIEKDIEKDVIKYKDYLNLPHEIWARFSQAMIKTRFYNVDFKDGKVHYKINPMRDAVNSFIREFTAYNNLPVDMKNRLIRKVAQFWHYEETKINEKNKLSK